MNNGIVALAVALMTSHASLALTAYKTYEKVSEKSLSQQPEMTLSALSQIDCAIKCRKYPHCTAFAYDDHASLCLLFSSMPATVADANHTSSSGLSVYTDTSELSLSGKAVWTSSASFYIQTLIFLYLSSHVIKLRNSSSRYCSPQSRHVRPLPCRGLHEHDVRCMNVGLIKKVYSELITCLVGTILP